MEAAALEGTERVMSKQTLPYFCSSRKCSLMHESKVIQFYPGSSTEGVGPRAK